MNSMEAIAMMQSYGDWKRNTNVKIFLSIVKWLELIDILVNTSGDVLTQNVQKITKDAMLELVLFSKASFLHLKL